MKADERHSLAPPSPPVVPPGGAADLEQRRLGRSDCFVSSIGLGCVTFGREIDEAAAQQIMDHALERGSNLFDTAAVYSGRESERIIGRWLKARSCRGQVVLATKVKGAMRRQALLESIDASLRALQCDRIDLFQLHEWPAADEPLDEALAAMDEAVRLGKVRWLGVSNASASQLREALSRQGVNGWARFESLQPPYSLVDRRLESELLPLCADQQVGIITYSPLAAGFLAGKYQQLQPIPRGTRFDVAPGHQRLYFKPENFALVDRLRGAAARIGVPMTELALAWVLTRRGITSVLIGARTCAHVDQALRARALEVPDHLFASVIQEPAEGAR